MKHTCSWQILVTNPKCNLNNLFSILNKYYITIAFCWCRSTIVLQNLWSFEYTCSNRWSCDQIFLNKKNSFGKKCSGVEKSANNKRDLYGKNSLNHSTTVFHTNPFICRNFQRVVYREFKYGMILKQATI